MQEGSGTYDLKLAHCCSGALAGKWLADVSGGPKSEVARHQRHVSLSVNSGPISDIAGCRRRAICGSSSSRQLVEQRLHLFQIARVKPLREPAVNRSKQFARLLRLTLVAPEPSEAHCGAEFPGFGLLLTSD